MFEDKRLEQYYLRLADIIGDTDKGLTPLIPVSRSQWLKGVKAGVFPTPLKISERILVWKKTDILELIKRIDTGMMLQLESKQHC